MARSNFSRYGNKGLLLLCRYGIKGEATMTPSVLAQAAARQGRRACSELSAADNLIQTFDDLRKLFGIQRSDFLANALRGKRTNLTDLYPGTLG